MLVFLPGYVALAQNETATLTGTVEDKSGAVIPNAHIVLTDVASGVTRETHRLLSRLPFSSSSPQFRSAIGLKVIPRQTYGPVSTVTNLMPKRRESRIRRKQEWNIIFKWVMRYPTQLTPGIWIVVNFIAIHRTEDGLVRQRGPPKKCSGQSLPSRY